MDNNNDSRMGTASIFIDSSWTYIDESILFHEEWFADYGFTGSNGRRYIFLRRDRWVKLTERTQLGTRDETHWYPAGTRVRLVSGGSVEVYAELEVDFA